MYRVIFLLVPPQKVLSVEDGKIPTKKVKVGVFNSKMLSFNSDFHFFAILNTLFDYAPRVQQWTFQCALFQAGSHQVNGVEAFCIVLPSNAIAIALL